MAGSVSVTGQASEFREPRDGEYAELHCLSHYSFLRAASAPAELVQAAAEQGYQALAITDECSFAGLVKAWQAAREVELKLLVGSEFHDSAEGIFIVLVCNQQGYRQLGHFITQCRRQATKGTYHFQATDLVAANLRDCVLLWLPRRAPDEPAAANLITQLPQSFKRCWLVYERHLTWADQSALQHLKNWQKVSGWPVVAASGVRCHQQTRLPLLQVLQAIAQQRPLSELGRHLIANGEARLRSLTELRQLYPADWLAETMSVARLCHFDLGKLQYTYPAEVVPQGFTPIKYLTQLGRQGLRWRYPTGVPAKVRQQLEQELTLVAELGYAHFFLTIHDLVQFARQQGILHQGRGSAANSVLCYCLGITAVNPAQSELLFERFISRERNEPPDIDVDFEHERREEVIQYIYRKYGRERAALAATVITYRLRSALRDVGKALGFPAARIEQFVQQLDRRDTEHDWQAQLEQLGVYQHPQGSRLVQLTTELLGTPRHLSQHVGGFVIAAGPVAELVPVENAAMPERTVIQWDKTDLEALCLLKVDVLSLGMLTAIRKTLQALPHFYQRHLQLADIPQDDQDVYRMLQRADSIGVFQVESRAQMNMLPRLKPRCFYDLVIQIAIVRPGPIQGDMVHPYLLRRDGQAAEEYPNAEVKSVLKRTLGVPIFQEQVIKLAMVAAGFSGGEADALRRAMASWRSKGQLLQFRDKLLRGMQQRGYTQQYAERVFEQICGFGEYGFPESHSASFANLAYASAWLKYHFPAAFYVGLLNSQPMGFYSASQLVQDARRHGVSVLPVCVQYSYWDHQLVPTEAEPAIRLGFRLVKGLVRQELEAYTRKRPVGGFQSVQELTGILSGPAMEKLASADALAALSGHRYQSRWDMTTPAEQLPLLQGAEASPGDHQLVAPAALDEVREDYQATGLTLGQHPMALLAAANYLPYRYRAADLPGQRSGQWVVVMGLVTNRQRPGSAGGVTFMTLEDETGDINIVLWQELARRQRKEWLNVRLLRVKGTLEKVGQVIHVVAGDLQDCSQLLAETPVQSRDFH